MRDDKIAVHAKAVNLARRLTTQIENDLLQEDFYEEASNEKKIFNHSYCQELARHLEHPKGLPEECKKFNDVVSDLKRRDTDTAHPTQWL